MEGAGYWCSILCCQYGFSLVVAHVIVVAQNRFVDLTKDESQAKFTTLIMFDYVFRRMFDYVFRRVARLAASHSCKNGSRPNGKGDIELVRFNKNRQKSVDSV